MNSNLSTQQAKVTDLLKTSASARYYMAYQSIQYFFHIYFAEYISYDSAPCQTEMLQLCQQLQGSNLLIQGFRNCGKSTILSTCLPLWSIMGKPQSKFIVIVSHTDKQSRLILKNIRSFVEHNTLLQRDIGPFYEGEDEWNAANLVFPKYKARISIVSSLSAVRGIRHGAHRPQLIIADDAEDLDAVATLEKRDKLESWTLGELLPAGDTNTSFVMTANKLHNDQLFERVATRIQEGKMRGTVRRYPIIEKNGMMTWPAKFPNEASIEQERERTGADNRTWYREYLLEILPAEDQIIKNEWIEHYEASPSSYVVTLPHIAAVYVAIDPAISQKDDACKTAMVGAAVYKKGDEVKIYILPEIVHAKLTITQQVQKAKEMNWTQYNGIELDTQFYVEDVGYQKALIQTMNEENDANTYSITPKGRDKRERLMFAAQLLEKGMVYFPNTHTIKPLIEQLLNFDPKSNNDLVDAFAYLMIQIDKDYLRSSMTIHMLDTSRPLYTNAKWY